MSCQNIHEQCWMEFPDKISFDTFVNVILNDSKIALDIQRKGNVGHYVYHVRFSVIYLPEITKIFKEGTFFI